MDEISMDTGKVCFGVKDTVDGLEMGAVEQLIVWENLEISRIHLRDPNTEENIIHWLDPRQEKTAKIWKNSEGQDMDVVEKKLFTEWIVENYKNYRSKLDFITDKSQEGNQFVKGFGGIGGILRYRVDFDAYDDGGSQMDSDSDFM